MKLLPKIVCLFLSLALLSGVLTLGLVDHSLRTILKEQAMQKGVALTTVLMPRLFNGFMSQDEKRLLPPLLSGSEQLGALYAMALDPEGRVLAHTNILETSKIYHDPLTREILKSATISGTIIHGLEGPVLDLTVPVRNNQEIDASESFFLVGNEGGVGQAILGYVRLGLPLQDAWREKRTLSRRIGAILIFVLALTWGIAWFSLRRALRPIQHLKEGTLQISRGHYATTLPVLSHDELGELAQSFNKMSQELAETTVSKNLFLGILNHMRDMLMLLSPMGHVRLVNAATLEKLGYEVTEWAQRPIEDVLILRDRSLEEVRSWILQGQAENISLEFLKKNGEHLPVVFSTSLLRDAQGDVRGVIVLAQDVTERQKIERIAQQAEKMSAVGQLAAGVAHEINNPLGVILGFVQSLRDRLKNGLPLEAAPFATIERETLRCKVLVENLLTFSRRTQDETGLLNLSQTLSSALPLIQVKARSSRVNVQAEFTESLPSIRGNSNQIQQVLINLANNAIDAMPQGGNLRIKTELVEEIKQSWVCLRVSDTGIGIPSAVLNHIFEPFYTTKPLGKGTGLGLSLVYEIVQKHAGTIQVSSQPGRTEFLLKFPIHTQSQNQKRAA